MYDTFVQPPPLYTPLLFPVHVSSSSPNVLFFHSFDFRWRLGGQPFGGCLGCFAFFALCSLLSFLRFLFFAFLFLEPGNLLAAGAPRPFGGGGSNPSPAVQSFFFFFFAMCFSSFIYIVYFLQVVSILF